MGIPPLTITAGQKDEQISGACDRALQASIDYLARYGGGTLSVRWNSGLAGFDVAVPNVVFGDTGAGYFEDGWQDYELGLGIEAFEFADGSSYSLEEFLTRLLLVMNNLKHHSMLSKSELFSG